MKKTIIALLTLSGVAMADYSVTLDKAGNGITATEYQLDGLTLTIDYTMPWAGSSDTFTATDYTNSLWAPGVNIGNGGSYYYSMTFTISDVVEDETLDSITLDFFTYNSDGQAQNAERIINAEITLTPQGEDPTTLRTDALTIAATNIRGEQDTNYTGSAYNASNEPQGSYVTWSCDDMNLTEGTYTLNVSVSKNAVSTGTFVGLGNMVLATSASAVPEPTTATLSLLALAGLAARRRRR